MSYTVYCNGRSLSTQSYRAVRAFIGTASTYRVHARLRPGQCVCWFCSGKPKP